jgi:hypothetical protein
VICCIDWVLWGSVVCAVSGGTIYGGMKCQTDGTAQMTHSGKWEKCDLPFCKFYARHTQNHLNKINASRKN